MTNHGFRVLILALLGLVLVGCTGSEVPAPVNGVAFTVAEHTADVEAWRARRHAALAQPDGWLSLVGLIWLEEGESSFGSDPFGNIVYAEHGTPPHLGTFTVVGATARFNAAPGVEIGVVGGDEAVTSMIVRQPSVEGQEPLPVPVLTWGPLRWHVMSRQGRLVIRLKDAQSPLLTGFDGVEMFPIDRQWRFNARFESYDPVKPLMIPNILGTIREGESPGAVIFELEGETHRLDMWKDSDDPVNFFTAFADQSNRDSTYGGGRFIWVDAPDEHGITVIDFNKAYNPPCVFTPHATCPLPPEQNRLPFVVSAGEKKFESGS